MKNGLRYFKIFILPLLTILMGSSVSAEWKPFARPISIHQSANASMALDRKGYPLVAWDEQGENIKLLRWNGADWVGLGDSASGNGISQNAKKSSENPRVVLDAHDNPAIVWQESSSKDNTEIFLKRWNGSAWAEVGTSASVGGTSHTPNPSVNPVLVLDKNGNPFVAWNELAESNLMDITLFGHPIRKARIYGIYLRYWDGKNWSELAGSASKKGVLEAKTDLDWPALALDSQSRPFLACSVNVGDVIQSEIYLAKWNGQSWALLSNSPEGGVSNAKGLVEHPVMAVDQSDNPYVTWLQILPSNAFDFKFDTQDVFVRHWNGKGWTNLDSNNSGGRLFDFKKAHYSKSPVMCLDREGHPVISWRELYLKEKAFHVMRWDGTKWIDLGDPFSDLGPIVVTDNTSPLLVLDQDGLPVVGCMIELDGGRRSEILFRKWKN